MVHTQPTSKTYTTISDSDYDVQNYSSRRINMYPVIQEVELERIAP